MAASKFHQRCAPRHVRTCAYQSCVYASVPYRACLPASHMADAHAAGEQVSSIHAPCDEEDDTTSEQRCGSPDSVVSPGSAMAAKPWAKWVCALELPAEPTRVDQIQAVLKCVLIHKRAQSDALPMQVIPGLWIGSIGSALHPTSAAHFTHIVCACAGIKPIWQGRGPLYLVCPVLDAESQDLMHWFSKVCAFILPALAAGGQVLVHCFAGRSRSAALIAAALIQRDRCSVPQAIQRIQAARAVACPNLGFLEQLAAFAASLGIPEPADMEAQLVACVESAAQARLALRAEPLE